MNHALNKLSKRRKKNMKNFIDKFGDKKILFGLEAQGHIPTIQAEIKRWNDSYRKNYPNEPLDMTYSKHVWNGIGKIIGWCPFSAALAYFEYLNEIENGNQSNK